MRRALAVTLLSGAALATTGAAPPPEEQAMLDAFDRVLTAMAYAASGLCLFAIVWAGFVLMAEGAEERGGGRAKTAVAMAVVGLVLVLLAKAVAALLRSGLVDFPTPLGVCLSIGWRSMWEGREAVVSGDFLRMFPQFGVIAARVSCILGFQESG